MSSLRSTSSISSGGTSGGESRLRLKNPFWGMRARRGTQSYMFPVRYPPPNVIREPATAATRMFCLITNYAAAVKLRIALRLCSGVFRPDAEALRPGQEQVIVVLFAKKPRRTLSLLLFQADGVAVLLINLHCDAMVPDEGADVEERAVDRGLRCVGEALAPVKALAASGPERVIRHLQPPGLLLRAHPSGEPRAARGSVACTSSVAPHGCHILSPELASLAPHAAWPC